MLAREAFPHGPGLDVTLADMEEIAILASRRIVQGALETMTDSQAREFADTAACPLCGRACPLRRRRRPMVVRGGDAILDEPVGHCPSCRRDFFPSASGVEN
jgi:hypothetical protein